MGTVQFLALGYRVCKWLYNVSLILYSISMLLVTAGVDHHVHLAEVLDSIFNFSWNNVIIVILLCLLGLMIQFHVSWHEEQEKQAKP